MTLCGTIVKEEKRRKNVFVFFFLFGQNVKLHNMHEEALALVARS